MENTEIIKALRCCASPDTPCKGLCSYHGVESCLSKKDLDAADALEAAEKRIVELNAKCANLQSQINEMENEIEELMPKRGEWAYGKTNYCTNCGADMRKGEHDEQADS